MSIPTPAACASPECRATSIRMIHCSSQRVAFDAVDGSPVFAEHVTYRCAQCGHTWGVRGFSSEDAGGSVRERSRAS